MRLNSSNEFFAGGSISISNGAVFIPSLTGQNRFGYNTDFSNRKKVMHEVLDTVMKRHFPDLQMYLDDSDQLYFYSPGNPVSISETIKQYEHILDDLSNDFDHIKQIAARDLKLSLKLYAHYGPVARYTCGNCCRIFGETVAEATELMKNSIDSRSFALISDEFKKASLQFAYSRVRGIPATNICHVYGERRHIEFEYFDYY